MRNDKKGHASLNELMGSSADSAKTLTLKDLPALLGEKMPAVTYDRIGRMRLVNALTQRFGVGYRNLPHVNNMLKEFDSEVDYHNVIRMNKRGVKNG